MKSLENFSQYYQEVTRTFYSKVFLNKIKHLAHIVNVVVQKGAEHAEHSADLYTLYNAYKGADHIVVESAYTVRTLVEQNLSTEP